MGLIKEIVRNKLNWHEDKELGILEYDRFDMSGYGDAHYKNLELLGRFKQYLWDSPSKNSDSWRSEEFVFPVFWKGSGRLFKTDVMGETVFLEEVSGLCTDEIIIKILKYQNPDLFLVDETF